MNTKQKIYVDSISPVSLAANTTEENASTLAEKLYTEHYQALYRYLCSRLHNIADAEDLVQTVFVKAFVSLKNGIWTGEGNIFYLFRIARNTLIDYYRRSKHMVIASDELVEKVADCFTTLGSAVDREQQEFLSMLVGKLRASEARAVTLRFFSDMEYESIAKIMNKREDAVRQLVHRGLRSLRALMEEDESYAEA